MTEGLIGVIVPVYKVEKYIAECIESILAQTYTNFRLILVDDGTPDYSGKICDEYARKDSRITVIHQENAGVTRARARGVGEAVDCEFITFVDGDDTIPTNSLETLIGLLNEKIDIVVGEYQEYSDKETTICINNCEYISKLVNAEIPQAPWGKLIRKKVFSEYAFDIPREITVGEDTIMNIRIATNMSGNVILSKHNIYNYRILPNSTFHSFNNTLSFQAEYFEILEKSIPNSMFKRILPSLASRAIGNWKPHYQYSSKRIKKEDLHFIRKTKEYIKECNYKLGLFDWIQLYCPVRVIRFIAVNIRKIKNRIL